MDSSFCHAATLEINGGDFSLRLFTRDAFFRSRDCVQPPGAISRQIVVPWRGRYFGSWQPCIHAVGAQTIKSLWRNSNHFELAVTNPGNAIQNLQISAEAPPKIISENDHGNATEGIVFRRGEGASDGHLHTKNLKI